MLLKDLHFNRATITHLAQEFAKAQPRGAASARAPALDVPGFVQTVLAGFETREFLERLDWIAACLEPHLPRDFPAMAARLEAAMPPPLDPTRTDDDFGHFIHAVHGVLAVRHGMAHPDRALDLLHAATQRFSMEFSLRPFLNHCPEKTLARLHDWARDPNYHVRRLVSEGTRPKLPWGKAIALTPEQTLPLLDQVHADGTRFVTRSVANHLNDLSKDYPDLVLDRLAAWAALGLQTDKELGWMRRHALRSLIKQGNARAMEVLGYDRDLALDAELTLDVSEVQIGMPFAFRARLQTDYAAPVLVDYVFWRTLQDGSLSPKVFKLKEARTKPARVPLTLEKTHKLKADAATFRLYPGPARLELQVNGRVVAQADFTLTPAA